MSSGNQAPELRRRKKLYVDPQVQGALIVRMVTYWAVCLVTVSLMVLCWRILTGPSRALDESLREVLFDYAPAVVASLALLPLVILDVLRLSNRFAGPLVRLRRAMRALARGEHVDPISFREGDFWLEFAQEFNAVAARVERVGGTAGPAGEEEPEAEAIGAGTG